MFLDGLSHPSAAGAAKRLAMRVYHNLRTNLKVGFQDDSQLSSMTDIVSEAAIYAKPEE